MAQGTEGCSSDRGNNCPHERLTFDKKRLGENLFNWDVVDLAPSSRDAEKLGSEKLQYLAHVGRTEGPSN